MRRLTVEEFQDLLKQLELPSEKKEKLINRVEVRKYSVYLCENNEEVEVSRGAQHFGSGGFDADFWKEVGDYEVIEKRRHETSFIYEDIFKIRPKETPLIVVYYRKDECGGWDNPVRWFNKDIYIWL